jgi:Domain of unknown function (DU1801)
MAKNKTTETDASVEAYIAAIVDESRRDDCRALVRLMRNATKKPPKMWGPSIIGFGKYHYKYASGHEGDMCLTGFSSRASAISIYLSCGAGKQFTGLLAKLGKHKMGKGCLSVKRLADVDQKVLVELVQMSIGEITRMVQSKTAQVKA